MNDDIKRILANLRHTAAFTRDKLCSLSAMNIEEAIELIERIGTDTDRLDLIERNKMTVAFRQGLSNRADQWAVTRGDQWIGVNHGETAREAIDAAMAKCP
jgi:hypothetical protein